MRLLHETKQVVATNYHFAQNVMQILSAKKRAFLFGVPCHSNMGDQAQTYCSIRWINKNYPKHKVIPIQTNEVLDCNARLVSVMRKLIKKDDLIFLHSGYHTTDIYPMEERMQRCIIETFPKHRIVIFPQTIFFRNSDIQNGVAKIYNAHPNLTLMCRDNISYEIAQKVFLKCNLICFPDIVTTLIGTTRYTDKREGILFCMRNDVEALYNSDEIAALRKRLTKFDRTAMTDTTISMNPNYIRKNREKVLNNIFKEYSKYKVIITDRYHGTIFSMIAATPVIVLGTTDHKLSSGVKWFPQQFSKYIHFVNNLDEVELLVDEIYKTKYDYNHSQYFNEEYYNRLKNLL